MTDGRDDKYDHLCPDKRYISFWRGAKQIAKNALWSNKKRQLIAHPSKVKRELEQLSRSLRKLSFEAQSSLWIIGANGSSFSPSSYLLGRIEVTLSGIPDGRPKFDEVRHYLGVHAAALWQSHGGDIKASEFEDFLETLIDDAGFGGEGKVRIEYAALAKQMRKEYENCDPPSWDPF